MYFTTSYKMKHTGSINNAMHKCSYKIDTSEVLPNKHVDARVIDRDFHF